MAAFKAVSLAACVLVLLFAGALVGRAMSLMRSSAQEAADE